MPRKSAAAKSLSVVTALPGQRLTPPERLSDEAAELWREVVAARPFDWFTSDTAVLLEAFVLAVIGHRAVSAQIRATDMKTLATPDGLAAFDRMTKIQERQARVAASMATKLRLTNQSRYTPQAANTAAAKVKGRRPWE